MINALLSLSLAGPLDADDGDEQWLDALPEEPLLIINGEDATLDEWPMTGGVVVDASGVRMLACTSTLIAPDVVLLAAHCMDPVVFGVGSIDGLAWVPQADLTGFDGSSVPELPEGSASAWDWAYHPDWSYANLQIGLAQNNDIALMFLDEPVTGVKPGVLPTAAEVGQLVEGAPLVVVGWGQRSQGGPAGTKQVGVSDLSELGDWEFHVGKETEAVRKCHGDSGGPSFLEVVSESTEPWRVVGVTSHTYDTTDCSQTGGVDTRVDPFRDWIDQEMRARCEDGTRSWCEEEGVLPPPRPLTEDEIDALEKELLSDITLVGGCSSTGGGARFGLLVLGLLALGARRPRR